MKLSARTAKGCGCLLLIVLAPLLLLKACQWSDTHPADGVMIEEFRRNQSAYSELRKLVSEEQRVTRVADDFIWIDGMNTVSEQERVRFLPEERMARYRALFTRLKLESGVIRYEDGSVGFLRSSSGMVTSGSSKEFIWSPHLKAEKLAASDRSTEDACVPKTGCKAIRQIAPEWYIAFESD